MKIAGRSRGKLRLRQKLRHAALLSSAGLAVTLFGQRAERECENHVSDSGGLSGDFFTKVFVSNEIEEALTQIMLAKGACRFTIDQLQAANEQIARSFQNARGQPDQTICSLAQRTDALDGTVEFDNDFRQRRQALSAGVMRTVRCVRRMRSMRGVLRHDCSVRPIGNNEAKEIRPHRQNLIWR